MVGLFTFLQTTKHEVKEVDGYMNNLANSRAKLQKIHESVEGLNFIPDPRQRLQVLDQVQEELESMILFISHGDTLSMKLSKQDLQSAKAVHEQNSKFKADWSATKSNIEVRGKRNMDRNFGFLQVDMTFDF